MFRQITPPHGWKEDSAFYYLRLTLPGFETKDVRIHMDKYGHLVVRGDKQVTAHKYISFEETFEVPNNADLEEASGLLEDDQIYCITIPKKQDGQRIGHAITMPKEEKTPVLDSPKAQDNKIGSFHKYESTKKPEEISPPQPPPQPQRVTKNPLNVITGDKSSKKKIAIFVAILTALLVVGKSFQLKFDSSAIAFWELWVRQTMGETSDSEKHEVAAKAKKEKHEKKEKDHKQADEDVKGEEKSKDKKKKDKGHEKEEKGEEKTKDKKKKDKDEKTEVKAKDEKKKDRDEKGEEKAKDKKKKDKGEKEEKGEEKAKDKKKKDKDEKGEKGEEKTKDENKKDKDAKEKKKKKDLENGED
ncbi:hypothetical protein Pfo_020656 [Paulownia fortunei]|nr:hypothetical protein Pfo_020656 [Paulownia fortunei]